MIKSTNDMLNVNSILKIDTPKTFIASSLIDFCHKTESLKI